MNLELVKQDSFGTVKCDFYKNENDEIYMTINQLAEALEYASKSGIENIMARNKYLYNPEFSTTHKLGVVEGGRTVFRKRIVFTEDGIYEVTMLSGQPKARAFRAWVRQIIKEIRRTGQYSINQPQTIEDLIIMTAQSMKEIRQQLQQQQKQLSVTAHRLDNLDAINLEGDLRQRLNKMIRKYAWQNGLDYRKAWQDFKQNFNTAFSTNIELLKTNYYKETGKEVSIPEIIEIRNMLPDALRVADKMLNR